jgi:hypothetical protein
MPPSPHTCSHFALKKMALLSASENASALQVANGQFSKISQVGHWYGTVLDVAHGMIATSTNFMHVLRLRSEPDQESIPHWPATSVEEQGFR